MPPSAAPTQPRSKEVKLISHSNLYYWWPVWVLAFFLAAWTYFEDHRLAIVPPGGNVSKTADNVFQMTFKSNKDVPLTSKALEDAINYSKANVPPFPARISANSWLGSLFTVVLVLTIIITNVPLRGLWSFLVILGVVLLAVIITLVKAWDDIFEKIGNLHIHINMAGYLTIGLIVFVIWAAATWIFDRRAYIIFTPGQIRYCEHVGAAVQAFSTFGVTLEKQRDDLFRHYILGFGSGDLIIKFTSGDRREIRVQNVLGIGWRIRSVEDMLRQISTTS
jgi:cation transport ATPase